MALDWLQRSLEAILDVSKAQTREEVQALTKRAQAIINGDKTPLTLIKGGKKEV